MAWDHLDIDKPHLAYMILGGFTSLFMLCSLLVKEKLYIGEATVATICGVIFGPHAADLFNPLSWGNTDKITLECSRIVLVVQCFAVGVELPKNYIQRHWKSVVFLLLPVMTYGWLITSLFIWWMFPGLSWLESLACAACVTATDPVLASSVVGKGKFAKRVPKHLRDLLSAESGCNDGMAFPFIYFATYLIAFKPHGEEFALHWVCYTILYECIVGAIFGFTIGYCGRHAIKYAEEKSLIDRESFLVFYFVLALFCAGAGSLLGMDDLLIGFACGVGFSNDGWFTEKTEESHVSNVIDLLLNLAYFVYFGSIIPWDQYNAPDLGIVPWRLVVLALFVIFFRRIPVMLALKKFIPDVKTWREALFAGHFGPIGVGAIFAAILARAELEHESTQPLDILPGPGDHNYLVVALIWPITTFLVISSIIVHGSSIAVFTLGKRINTLTITMSYTQNDDGPSWMNRLPRVQSTSKSSMSIQKADSKDETTSLPEYPPGTLPPIGVPGNFLRRQGDDDRPSETNSRPSSISSRSRRRKWGKGNRPGGPISQSAITPQRRPEIEVTSPSDGEGEPEPQQPEFEVYQEGRNMVIEDKDGNVLKTDRMEHKPHEEPSTTEENQRESSSPDDIAKPDTQTEEAGEAEKGKGSRYQNIKKQFGTWVGFGKEKEEEVKHELSQKDRTRRSAHAYQFGNTVIVEDEEGEVVRKYDIPPPEKPKKGAEGGGDTSAGAGAGAGEGHHSMRRRLSRMGTWVGKDGETSHTPPKKSTSTEQDEDAGLRFTVKGEGARRMSKQDFIQQIQKLDPKAHHEISEEPEGQTSTKKTTGKGTKQQGQRTEYSGTTDSQRSPDASKTTGEGEPPTEVPTHDVAASLAKYIPGHEESAASARRRKFSTGDVDGQEQQEGGVEEGTSYDSADSEDDGTERIPPSQLRRTQSKDKSTTAAAAGGGDSGETPAERRRRLAVLSELDREDNGGEDEDEDEEAASRRVRAAVQEPQLDLDAEDEGDVKRKVQFADETKPERQGDGDVGTSGEASGEASGNGDGNGNGNGGEGNKMRISWA